MTGPDALDVSLVDAELLTEVHLATELIIAVQTFDRALTTAEIDEILQVDA